MRQPAILLRLTVVFHMYNWFTVHCVVTPQAPDRLMVVNGVTQTILWSVSQDFIFKWDSKQEVFGLPKGGKVSINPLQVQKASGTEHPGGTDRALLWTPFLGSADAESAEHLLHSVVLKMKGVCLLESFLVPEGGCWFSLSSLLLLQDKNSYPSHGKLTRPCPLILLCKDRWRFLSEKKV